MERMVGISSQQLLETAKYAQGGKAYYGRISYAQTIPAFVLHNSYKSLYMR